MRGRKADPAGQIARGNPGKRQSRAEKLLTQAHDLAARFASATATQSDPVALPFFFDETFAVEAEVWRIYAPQLRELNLLRETHRLLFAGFCVFYAQWLRATIHLRKHGEVVSVKFGTGSRRDVPSPWLEVQKSAWREVMVGSEKFGLNPADGYKLMREQAALLGGRSGELPFNKPAPAAGDTPPQPEAIVRPHDDMSAFDSAPPGTRPN